MTSFAIIVNPEVETFQECHIFWYVRKKLSSLFKQHHNTYITGILRRNAENCGIQNTEGDSHTEQNNNNNNALG